MHLPYAEVNATYFHLYYIELPLQTGLEILYLALQVVLKTLLADLLVNALIEPFNHSVLYLTDALQVGEVLLELVAIRRHALQSIVVADVFLVRDEVKYYRLPSDGLRVDDAHERHDRHGYLNIVLGADWCDWNRVRANVARPVELPLFLVHPLPARLSRGKAVELVRDVLQPDLFGGFMPIAGATEDQALAGAGLLDLELDDLIDSGALLSRERNLILPQSHRMIFEILPVHSLEILDRWLHLPLKFEQDVPTETLTKLRKTLDQSSIIARQHDEDIDWDVLRIPHKWFDLLFKCLF